MNDDDLPEYPPPPYSVIFPPPPYSNVLPDKNNNCCMVAGNIIVGIFIAFSIVVTIALLSALIFS